MLYSVFKQLPPVLTPGKRMGEEVWSANLQYMGNVSARSSDEAIEAGRKYCKLPIVQKGGAQ
jgi:hypothetical protein